MLHPDLCDPQQKLLSWWSTCALYNLQMCFHVSAVLSIIISKRRRSGNPDTWRTDEAIAARPCVFVSPEWLHSNNSLLLSLKFRLLSDYLYKSVRRHFSVKLVLLLWYLTYILQLILLYFHKNTGLLLSYFTLLNWYFHLIKWSEYFFHHRILTF